MRDLPEITDFTGPDEMLVEVTPGEKPDGGGRVQFTAFWIDSTGLTPTGVRAQVFNTRLDEFTAREEAKGHPIRVIA